MKTSPLDWVAVSVHVMVGCVSEGGSEDKGSGRVDVYKSILLRPVHLSSWDF